jgi:hypothetical protein
MTQSMDEKQADIDSCSCPRLPGEILVAPKCTPENVIGGFYPDNGSMLFVGGQQNCKHLVGFGNGNFCTCRHRLQVYEKYGL